MFRRIEGDFGGSIAGVSPMSSVKPEQLLTRHQRRQRRRNGGLDVPLSEGGKLVNGVVHFPLTDAERRAYLLTSSNLWPPKPVRSYGRQGDPKSTFAELPHLSPKLPEDLPGKPPEGMTRRQFLGDLAVAAVMGAEITREINREAAKGLWPPFPPRVYEIEAEVAKRNDHSATFVFGGLGIRDSGEEVLAIRGALQDIGRVVAVRYGNDQMDLDAIAADMNNYIEKNGITEISIYGDSMGGIAGVHTLPKLDLSLNGGVRVKYIFADCTPITKANVREQNASIPEFLAEYTNFNGGGFLGKFFGQLYQNFNHPDDWLKIKLQLENAWQTTLDPNSPGLWIDQLRLVSQSTVESFANCLAEVNYEQMFYVHPRNVANDVVVYDISALNDLRLANEIAHGWRRHHDEKVPSVTSIAIPFISHASCVEHPIRYTAALRGVLTSAS